MTLTVRDEYLAALKEGQKGILCTSTAGGQGMAALIEK